MDFIRRGSSLLLAITASLVSPIAFSGVTVSPGGYTTFSGSVTISASLAGHPTYSITCDMTMQGYITTSNGNFTINSASFAGGDCDDIVQQGGFVEGRDFPWIGTTTGYPTSVYSSISGQHIVILTSSFAPPLAYNCENLGVYTMDDLEWNKPPGTASTKFLTTHITAIGKTASGATCRIQALWNISPFQTFTFVP